MYGFKAKRQKYDKTMARLDYPISIHTLLPKFDFSIMTETTLFFDSVKFFVCSKTLSTFYKTNRYVPKDTVLISEIEP